MSIKLDCIRVGMLETNCYMVCGEEDTCVLVDPGYQATAILEQVQKGRQAYVICPMVEPEENDLGLENVVEYANKLRSVLPETVQIAYLHGKMKASQKDKIMQEFSDKHIDVLVSTIYHLILQFQLLDERFQFRLHRT